MQINPTTYQADQCSVCLEDWSKTKSLTLSCGHQFHRLCAFKWQQQNPVPPRCALCNKTITPIVVTLTERVMAAWTQGYFRGEEITPIIFKLVGIAAGVAVVGVAVGADAGTAAVSVAVGAGIVGAEVVVAGAGAGGVVFGVAVGLDAGAAAGAAAVAAVFSLIGVAAGGNYIGEKMGRYEWIKNIGGIVGGTMGIIKELVCVALSQHRFR